MVEYSPIRLIDPNKLADHPAQDWEYDFHLLSKLAALSGMKPFNLLRKICWSVGEGTDTTSFFVGQPLSATVRARLQILLNPCSKVLHRAKLQETIRSTFYVVPRAPCIAEVNHSSRT